MEFLGDGPQQFINQLRRDNSTHRQTEHQRKLQIENDVEEWFKKRIEIQEQMDKEKLEKQKSD